MFAAIETGQRDGSVAMTLWGFMHGIIQMVATKSALLGQYGLTSKALVDQALKIAAEGISPGR